MIRADGEMPAELSKLQKSYELLGELSRDQMVTIYVARDKLSGEEVAIKVLRAVDARGREALAHYASDARLLTALEHPNIVAVHAVKWLSEDAVAVITERVRGPSLRQVLDVVGTLPVTRATEVLRGLGNALAWAHSSQIIHRDMRPENVIFEDGTGRVVLSDFGLARRIEGAPGASDPSADAYRAPELADGRYPDRRTDVYSLGIVGWELLTGRRPWPDTMEPIEPGRQAPAPPPLAEIRPGLPPALVAAVEGAVQLDRNRRITDVATFLERVADVAPPQSEEEVIEEIPDSLRSAEWVALPVPKLPEKPQTRARGRREGDLPHRGAGELADRPAADAGGPGGLRPPSAPAVGTAATPSTLPESAEGQAAAQAEPESETVAPKPEVVAPKSDVLETTPEGAQAKPEGVGSAPEAVTARPETVETTTTGAAHATTAGVSAAERGDLAAASGQEAGGAAEREVEPRGDLESERGAQRVAGAHRALDREMSRPIQRAADREPRDGGAERGVEERVGHETARATERPPAIGVGREGERSAAATGAAEREVALTAPVTPPESPGPQPSRAESVAQPRVDEARPSVEEGSVAAAPPSGGSDGVTAPAPGAPLSAGGLGPRESQRRGRRKKDRGSRGAVPLADAPPGVAPPAGVRRSEPGAPEMPPGPLPAASEQPIDGGRVDVPAVAPALGRAPGEAGAAGVEHAPGTPVTPRRDPQFTRPMSPIPTDVELPPPEPVPFADLPAAPLRGPISDPVRRAATEHEEVVRAPGPFAGMRGGLGAPRARKSSARSRRASGETPAPLQPVWDTPAEFPLPAIPDPRPMPADVSVGGPGAPQRRWTRRRIAVAAGALMLILAAVLLARMERAPDSSAELMEPEIPAGYGGDIDLKGGGAGAGRGTAVPGDSVAPEAGGSGARAPSGAAPARPAPGSSRGRSGASGAAPNDRGTSPNAARRPDAASPPASRESPPPPVARTERTPPPTSEAPASATAASSPAPCASPAASSQRACLQTLIDRNDASLNQVYADLVAAMRQRANSAPGDPDPPEVQRLRARQRAWLSVRDAECRRRGRGREGPLWAPSRAQCLAEYSAARERDLSATLTRLRRD